MARLFIDTNFSYMTYILDGDNISEQGYEPMPGHVIDVEAEYIAIMYGLNQYYLAWNRELDARQEDMDVEKSKATGEPVFAKVATPEQCTERPLPPPVIVYTGNEAVVRQLSGQQKVVGQNLHKLATQIWNMTKNVEVRFQWVSKKENLAGKILP
jgi:hypothetical protein